MAFREKNAAVRALNEVRGLRRAKEDRDEARDQQKQQATSQERAIDRGFEARQSRLGRRANIAGQRMASKSQLGLAKFGAENEMKLQGLRGQQKVQQAGLARFKAPGKKGGLTTKNRFDIRKGLNEEFYGDNPAGEALREHYGEKGFGMFATEIEKRYQPQQQPGLPARPQPPDQIRAYKDPATGVWQGGQQRPGMSIGGKVEQPAMLPSIGRVNATLPPSPQPVSETGLLGPEDFEGTRGEIAINQAMAPAPSLSEFNQARVDQREAKLAEAFGRPLKKKALPLPGKSQRTSLLSSVMKERAMRQGGSRYYNR